jgi:hypothetical protein
LELAELLALPEQAQQALQELPAVQQAGTP